MEELNNMKYTTLVNNKPAIKINKDGNVIVKIMKGNDKLKFKETDSLVDVGEYDNNFATLPTKPFDKMDYSKTPGIILDNDTSQSINKDNAKRIQIVQGENFYGFAIITPDDTNEAVKNLLDAIRMNKIESIQIYSPHMTVDIVNNGGKDNRYIKNIKSITIISIKTK